MANEKALKRYMSHTRDASDALETITAYLRNHGDVVPESVDWGDVGTMAEVSSRLHNVVNFINGHEDEE